MERRTILAQNLSAPRVQAQSNVDPGQAFGNFSGLQHFGNALADTGATIMQHKEDRDNYDANLAITKTISQQLLNTKIAADQAIAADPDHAATVASKIYDDGRKNLDLALADLTKSNEGNTHFKRILSKDYVDLNWTRGTAEGLESAYMMQAHATLRTRQQTLKENADAQTNLAGTNVGGVVDAALLHVTEAGKANLYGRGYDGVMRDSMRRPVLGAFKAAIVNNHGVTQDIADNLDRAHSKNLLTTEDVSDLKTFAAGQMRVNEGERNNTYQNYLTQVENGTNDVTVNDCDQFAAKLYGMDGPETVKARQTDLLLAKALGNMNRRGNNGDPVLPWTPLTEGAPSMSKMEAILSDPNRRDDIRWFMQQTLADVPRARINLLSDADVDRFRTKAQAIVKSQAEMIRTGQAWKLAQSNPQIAALAQNPTKQLRAVDQWFDRHNIPQEYRGYVNTQVMTNLVNTHNAGDAQGTVDMMAGIVGKYGNATPALFARTLATDPSTRNLGGILRFMSQAETVKDSPDLYAGIVGTGKSLIYADNYAKKALAAKPDAAADINHIRSFVKTYKSDGLVTMQAVQNALEREDKASGQDMGAAITDAVTNLVYMNMRGFVDDKALPIQVDKAFKDLSKAFVPVRVNGMYSESPDYMLITPKYSQGWFQRFVLGTDPKSTRSLQETSSSWSHAMDAWIMDARPSVKESHFLGGIQNWVGESLANSWIHKRYDNRSNEFYHGADPIDFTYRLDSEGTLHQSPVHLIPEDKRIPFQDLVIKNSRGEVVPVSHEPIIFKSTWKQQIDDYLKKEIIGQPGTDLTSKNWAAVVHCGSFRPVPGGNMQMTMHIPEASVGQVSGGNELGEFDVYYRVRDANGKFTGEVKPFVRPMSDINEFAERQAKAKYGFNLVGISNWNLRGGALRQQEFSIAHYNRTMVDHPELRNHKDIKFAHESGFMDYPKTEYFNLRKPDNTQASQPDER